MSRLYFPILKYFHKSGQEKLECTIASIEKEENSFLNHKDMHTRLYDIISLVTSEVSKKKRYLDSEFTFVDANPYNNDFLNYIKLDDCERTSLEGGLTLRGKDEQQILIVFYKECQFKVYDLKKTNTSNDEDTYLYEGKPLQLSKLTRKKLKALGCSNMSTSMLFRNCFCLYKTHRSGSKVAPWPTSAI